MSNNKFYFLTKQIIGAVLGFVVLIITSKIDYKVENDIHYSKKLDYNDKVGYIRIEKLNKGYFVEFVYNYAKMEACVTEENLANVITNMCYILRTIKFNDAVLESLIGENVLSYKEEEFTLFENNESSDVFLETADPESISEEKNVFDDEGFDFEEDEDSIFDE